MSRLKMSLFAIIFYPILSAAVPAPFDRLREREQQRALSLSKGGLVEGGSLSKGGNSTVGKRANKNR
ncbi:Uncharacterized protein dnm_076250 [Desulfonema magnum]|uniref:Uncharacterized protein n=1 Tax=Desulfonema magnum TaxID=45655 RepID=A0A975BUT8_9BACT|nr:Uncharacterized protein dnm_076250 [Desulfonema magnum]